MKVSCDEWRCKYNRDMRCRRTDSVHLEARGHGFICRDKELDEQRERHVWRIISNGTSKEVKE